MCLFPPLGLVPQNDLITIPAAPRVTVGMRDRRKHIKLGPLFRESVHGNV